MEEIEAKFLDIDPADIEAKLAAAGAKKIGDYLFRNIAFDYPGFPLDKDLSWLRLRDETTRVALAFKKRLAATSNDGSSNDGGVQEIEIEVSDYEKTRLILMSIGMVVKFAQEKKRTKWLYEDIHFDIDTWPRLKPYLEIESDSWDKVDKGAKMLGLNPADKKIFSTTQVYALNGIRDKDYIKMTFDEFVKREHADR